MKGKIYKNKLNTTTSPLTTPIQHLNTQISTINPPYSHYVNHPQSPGSQILSPKTQHPKKSFIYELVNNDQLSQMNRTNNNSNGLGTFIDQLNQQFTNGYQQQRNGNENMNNPTINHILTQMNSPSNQQQKLNNTNKRTSLKRVLSNPNIGSYQFLGGQENREDEIDPIDEASVLDKSVEGNCYYSKFRQMSNNNNAKNTSNNIFGNNLCDTSMHHKTQHTNTKPFSHLSHHHQFTTTSPIYPTHHQTLPPTLNPLLQTSNPNLYLQTPLYRPQQPFTQTDYITQYQKRHKQRVASLQSQHELEVQFYQQEIRGRDETIEEMRRMLKEKEDIIRRLQADNANLSSRSYISFANGNNCCGKD